MRDLTSLIVLNIITLICCLPIVTAGAAIASMHYVMYQMIEDEEGHIVRSYLKQFKGNLRNATSIWMIMLLFAGLLYFEYSTFKEMAGAGRIVIIFVYVGVLLLAMLAVWLFPLTAKFVYSTTACFQNAVVLCISKLIRTIAMVVIMSVIPFILTHDMRLAPLAFLLGLSLPGYFCALIYHPVFEDMIKKMQKRTEKREDSEEESKSEEESTPEEENDPEH